MKIAIDAVDKTGMTLDELQKFVEQMKANGATGQEVPVAKFTVRGKISRLEASA